MNTYDRLMNKFIEKIGEHNLPFVYCFLFLLVFFGVISQVYFYTERVDDMYESQLSGIFQDIDDANNKLSFNLNEIHQENQELIQEINDLHDNIKRLNKDNN